MLEKFTTIKKLPLDNLSCSLDFLLYPQEKKIDTAVDDLCSRYSKGQKFIFSILWELRPPNLWIHYLKKIFDRYPTSVLLLGRNYENDLDFFVDIDYVLVDVFAIYNWYEYNVIRRSKLNKNWISNTNKFLFLSGRPYKPHRIGLLYKLSNADLLPYCVWSLYVNKENWNRSRTILPMLTDKEFSNFVKIHNKKIGTKKNQHPWGYPHSCRPYQRTSFRLVAESHVNNHSPQISEKTWVTMSNKHPFVMAGDLGSLHRLKKYGFKTFEEYLGISDYDSTLDIDRRLDMVVENTRDMLSACKKYETELRNDIEHNFVTLDLYMKQNLHNINTLFKNLGLDNFNIWAWLPLSQTDTWKSFYYQVKDESWPDCYEEEYFVNLPMHIQTELITIFGYVPTHK